MSSEAPAIGIDLGTTYSCVAVVINGRVEVIANDVGSRTTPSVVAFTETELMIGTAAVNQASRNLENTIYDVKRIIGRKFSDPKLQEDMKHWPFTVVEDEEQPKIQLFISGEFKTITPEQVSAYVLTKMRETAEDFLGEKVSSAIITVPAYFNNCQRQATIDAATIAGLNVLRIINEPTAAAIAYGLNKKSEKKLNVLVFDLGGGTFDVSIVSIKNGIQIVKATAGDTHLGGEDFDNNLVDYVLEQFKQKHQVDLTGNKRMIRRLKTECEKAKRTLSVNTHAEIEVALGENDNIFPVSRAFFEDLNKDLFQRTIDCVKEVLKDAEMDKKAIDEVVLVGGSTRIPKVQQLLQEFFDGKKLNKTINPDEAVAAGAAVHAAALNNKDAKEGAQKHLIDVIPLSLGIESGVDDHMTVVIPRNTQIPVKKTKQYVTAHDHQTSIKFAVYEGERPFTKDNNLLGEFKLHDVKPGPKGTEEFDVTFAIDANGILKVSAVDLRSGNRKEITIANNGRLSKAKIDQMIKDAEKFRAEDQKTLKRNALKMELEAYCINMRNFVKFNENSNKISDADEKKILEQSSGAVLWMNTNPMEEPEEYAMRLQELENLCKSLMDKYNRDSSAHKKKAEIEVKKVEVSSNASSGSGGDSRNDLLPEMRSEVKLRPLSDRPVVNVHAPSPPTLPKDFSAPRERQPVPPLPASTPPVNGTSSRPAPVVNNNSTAPPPPPPPPPPMMPPAPPMMNINAESKKPAAPRMPTTPDPRNALMDSIRKGVQLKKVEVSSNAPSSSGGDSRNDLLPEIREEVEPRPLSDQPVANRSSGDSSGTNALLDAIRRDLKQRKVATQGDSDSNLDDGEWSG